MKLLITILIFLTICQCLTKYIKNQPSSQKYPQYPMDGQKRQLVLVKRPETKDLDLPKVILTQPQKKVVTEVKKPDLPQTYSIGRTKYYPEGQPSKWDKKNKKF